MRQFSKKTARRNAEARPFRRNLVKRIGRCEVCGHDPLHVRPGAIRFALHVHEIRGNSQRSECQDKPYGVLVVCEWCHLAYLSSSAATAEYPESRQLAILKRSRPAYYDLAAYLEAFHPNAPQAVTEDEVNRWLQGGDSPAPS